MTHNPISTPISLSHLFRLRRDERWMMLVVALLLVAALIETYVTPALLNLVL